MLSTHTNQITMGNSEMQKHCLYAKALLFSDQHEDDAPVLLSDLKR